MRRIACLVSKGHVLVLVGALLAGSAGCNMAEFMANQMPPILEVTEGSFNSSRDVQGAREAAPALLAQLDGFIAASPENPDLLLSGARMNSSFAFAFLEKEDPRRARIIYEKAREYGLRALEVWDEARLRRDETAPDGGVAEALRSKDPARIRSVLEHHFRLEPIDDQVRGQAMQGDEAALAGMFPPEGSGRVDEELLPPLFHTAFAWGGLINVSRDDLDAVADLPSVEAVMEVIIRVDPDFHFAGAHLFEAVFHGDRAPAMGGNPDLSAWHFQRVFNLTQGKFLLAHVLYAETLAVSTQDREAFLEHLDIVEDLPADAIPEQSLAGHLAKRRAEELRREVDDLILPPLD